MNETFIWVLQPSLLSQGFKSSLCRPVKGFSKEGGVKGKENMGPSFFRWIFDAVRAPVEVDKYHLLALGILAVISGPFYSWNVGLKSGFGSFAIMTGLMGWAYNCFCFCASELSSALPFAGGSYGLARCTLGYYLGFMTGSCEIMYYILLTGFINNGISDFVISAKPNYHPYMPSSWSSSTYHKFLLFR